MTHQNTSHYYDLMAGASTQAKDIFPPCPVILVFDSGLGGLTVFSEILKTPLNAQYIYVADNAGFPYGRLSEKALQNRLSHVFEHLIKRYQPDMVVVACNTASTIAMPILREQFTIPFVATVPAIKPAAQLSQTKYFTVLATPGTITRDYTKELIAEYAHDCHVTLVGSRHLASLAEAVLHGKAVSDKDIQEELAPCFIEKDGQRTDVITLACTHYPLLLEHYKRLSPWPVTFLDPAPAVARRIVQLVGPQQEKPSPPTPNQAIFTSTEGIDQHLQKVLVQWGLSSCSIDAIPFAESKDG